MPISDFQPGDKIGFSGNVLESGLINLGTYGCPNFGYYWPPYLSHLSHVAYVARYNRRLYLVESTTDEDCPLPCAITGRKVDGVQAHPIEERVCNYKGRVWHYPLVTPLYPDQVRRSNQFTLEFLGRGYDERGAITCGIANWTTGLRLVSRFLSQDSLETLFCSELVAAHDARVGIFATDRASLWTPNYLVRYQRRKSILKKPIRLR